MPDLKIRQALWNDLQAAAAKQGEQPESLASKALKEFLDRLADDDLIARSQRAARRAKLRIGEAEQAIRRHRSRKHWSKRAAAVVSRKQRNTVVLDTNVLVRALKTRSLSSPNQRILRLWLLSKRLQLVVSDQLVEEYLQVFAELLDFDSDLLDEWEQRFLNDARSTVVNLGRRYNFSRDPDDNLLLATAAAGPAEYLISNDRDLLDIDSAVTSRLPFQIVSPAALLRRIESAL
jgi:uncharacterized protein